MKPPYNIQIEFLDVGARVQVGCKSLAYADLQQMLIDLAAYVNDPKTTIKLMQEQHPGLYEQEPRGLYEQAREDLAGIAAQGLSSYVTNR
jgi:hypothetical protein